MYLSTAIVAALCSLASARPTSDILPRAGGPAIDPIPSTCSVTNPLPTSNSPDAAYSPGPSTTNDALYSAYYPSFSSNTTEMAEQCLEQCYGYGSHIECKTGYWAENVPTPPGYYGTAGGDLMTACLLFSRALESSDFVVAPAGQAANASAGNIAC